MRIREARTAQKISQKELAARIKVAQNTLSQYETGKREPDIKTINRIADILAVSTDYLLGRTDDPRPVGKIGETAPAVETAPPGYTTLSPTQRAAVDQMIAAMKENEPSNVVPFQFSAIARGGAGPTTEVDSEITLPKNTKVLPAQDNPGTDGKASVPEEK